MAEWIEGIHIEGGFLDGTPCVKIWVSRPGEDGEPERFDLLFPAEQVAHLCEALTEAAVVMLHEQDFGN